jgi:hypothetical protein
VLLGFARPIPVSHSAGLHGRVFDQFFHDLSRDTDFDLHVAAFPALGGSDGVVRAFLIRRRNLADLMNFHFLQLSSLKVRKTRHA